MLRSLCGALFLSSRSAAAPLSALRTMSSDAAPRALASAGADGLTGFMLLEHVNLTAPDLALAHAFYVDGLNCQLHATNRGDKLLHVNMGLSQFHVPLEPEQVWRGTMELWTTEPLAGVRDRIVANPVLKDHGVTAELEEEDRLAVRGVYGNRFVLTPAPATAVADIAAAGSHAGGTAAVVAMPAVTHPCRPGHAKHIAAFYRDIMGCPVEESDGRLEVRFVGGSWPPQSLVFEETPDAPDPETYDTVVSDQYHVAVYYPTEEAFEAAWHRAFAAGAVWVNPRFEHVAPQFASAETEEVAFKYRQFRVKDLKNPATGELGIVMEHEVRGPTHVACPVGKTADRK